MSVATAVPVDGVTRNNIVGMRLLALGVEGYPQYTGKAFNVTDVHASTNTRWTNGLAPRGNFGPGDQPLWVTEWDVCNEPILPGMKVRALNVPLFPQYEGAEVTLTAVDGGIARGEFESIEKPDDTISLAFTDWKRLDNDLTMPVEVGDKVIAVKVIGIPYAEGRIGTVRRSMHHLSVGDKYVVLDFEAFTDSNGIERPAETWNAVEWWPAPATAVPQMDALVADQIRRLEGDLASVRAQYESAQARANLLDSQFERSIEIIGNRMLEEARRRGWCDEFNRIIAEVNADLPAYELSGGATDWDVTWVETFTVTVSRSATFTAASVDDAIEQAQNYDSADSYMVREAISDGNFSYEGSEDYEAEEE